MAIPSRNRHRRSLWLATVLALVLPHGASQAQPAAAPLLETELILLEVRLDQYRVSDALPGYQRGRELLLPLGELARLLTIAIRVDPGQGTATGFVLQEDRSFHLDVRDRTVVIQDRRQAVAPGLIERAEDDIYVAASLLSQWLPLDLDPDLPALVLKVKPREPLPLQRRIEREQRAAGLRGEEEAPGASYARRDFPYRMFDFPFADATLATDFRHTPEADSTDTQYTLFLTGDLLRMEAAVYAGRTAGQGDEFRATLGRTDPDGRLLGPLRARAFALGSVVIPGVANVARTSPVGYGAALGNRPLTRPTNFDRHSLQGDLPPGWDVELYFNEALVGFQQSGPGGRYEFNDLPLLYGANEFRLVFHGPQGQLRVERESFLLEDSLVPAGAFQYQLAWHRDPFEQPRALTQIDFGFNRHLSATAGWYGLTSSTEVEHRYGFGGLHLAWGPFLLNGDAVRMEQGGSLTELGLKTRLGGLTLGLSQDRLDEFSSDFFPLSADPIRVRDIVRADGVLDLPPLPRLPVTVEFRRDRLGSGAEHREANGRISAYAVGTSLTNQYRWQSLAGLQSADGALQISRRVAGTGVRGQISYLLQPEKTLSNVSLAADRGLEHGYQLNLGVSRGFVVRETLYTAGLNKVLGEYALGISASYSSQRELVLGARLFMALGREPRNGKWLRNAQPMADTGALSARVFVDENLNGVHDAGEMPVSGAEFTINGARAPVRSDAEGYAYLDRLTPRQFADIAVDPGSLEDPQWAAQPAGLRMLPRPGHVAVTGFPVITTSEIDGTLYALDRGTRRGVGGVEIVLQDRHSNVIRRTTTAADGFYIVPSVPPGEYLLVSPDHIRRFLRDDTGIRLIRVPADGQFVSGVDFILGRRGPAAPRAPAETPARNDYIVQPGDWIWSLAERFYGEATTVNANKILEANRNVIDRPETLRPGLRLVIPRDARFPAPDRRLPGPAPVSPGKAASSSGNQSVAPRYYTVQKGDWLWKLAERFYGEATTINVDKILEANRGVIPDSRVLRPGQKIVIPADAARSERSK